MLVAFFEHTDVEALVDALYELNRHYFGHDASTLEVIRAHVVSANLGPDSGVRVVTALDGGRVAGVATVSLLYPAPQERAQLFMKDLYVCEAWRGQGVGQEIMRFLAQYAVSKNCIRFDWTTERTNQGAMSFYERLGARRVEEKVYYRMSPEVILELAQSQNPHSAASDA
jgi:GNAT superfamily N-acetyltransferase